MAATTLEIITALRAPFVTVANGGTEEWEGTPYSNIGYGNATINPASLPSPPPWIEVVVSAGTRRALDASLSAYSASPTVVVSAHTDIGIGQDVAQGLIDAAYAIYEGRLFAAGTSKLHAYAFSQPVPMPMDGYYRLSGQISFRLY